MPVLYYALYIHSLIENYRHVKPLSSIFYKWLNIEILSNGDTAK